MKILLFCPLNPELDHSGNRVPQLFGRTNQSIFRQDYPQLDIWFSKGDNPFFDNNGRNNILHNYKKARRMALDGGYDALLTIEADMILPVDALSKLAALEADVAYGLYVFKATATLSAFTELSVDGGRSLRKDPDLARREWGNPIDVAGVGLGCTLIRRNVLEAIDFRLDELRPTLHNDWFFAVDCQEHGFRQVCHTGVQCGHIAMKPSPRIIWPDIDQPRFYRNDYLDTIKHNPDGSIEIPIGLGEYTFTRKDLGLPAD